jgi:hypothetical protein
MIIRSFHLAQFNIARALAPHAYTYRSGHAGVFRQRKHWFEPSEKASAVMWWLGAGHIPTVDEGRTRLEHLWEHGPTPFAFPFRQPFPPSATA